MFWTHENIEQNVWKHCLSSKEYTVRVLQKYFFEKMSNCAYFRLTTPFGFGYNAHIIQKQPKQQTHNQRGKITGNTTKYCGEGARYEDFGGAHTERWQGESRKHSQSGRISKSSY